MPWREFYRSTYHPPSPPTPPQRNPPRQTSPPNSPPTEEKEGFKLLFDGVTSSGWRQLGQPDAKELPKGWDVQDSSIHHIPRGGGGDITTGETYDSFELRFDFKIAV